MSKVLASKKPILDPIEATAPIPLIFVVIPLVIQLVSEVLDKFIRATAKAEILCWNFVTGIPHSVMPSPLSKLLPLHVDKPAFARIEDSWGFVSQPFGLFFGGFLVSRTALNPVADKLERE